MILKTQIITLIFSFIFGMYFSLFISINRKFIYDLKRIYRIPITFICIIANSLIYFLILEKLNYGVIHIYLLLALVLGLICEHYLEILIEMKRKK